MFAYIKGTLEIKGNDYVVIDVNGVGYKIFAPLSTIERLGEIGSTVKVHTHYYVREDNISLYGFYSLEELRMFELLIGVSGVGAKSANAILANITPSRFALAVITNDIKELTKQKITERVHFYIRVCLKYFRINHFINKMKAKWERK